MPSDKLLLVCGRHPWSCHPAAPIIWQIGSQQNELCCQGHARHFLAAWPHFSTTNTQQDSSNQVYRGPYQKVPRWAPRHRSVPWWVNHQAMWQCQTCHTYSQKCPISICHRVKAELDKMVILGVIIPVDEPLDWISSVAYAWKMSSVLCLCLDPCDPNNAIHRDHHCTHTVDEIAHDFAHSRYFTNLDGRHGYWAVVLDSKSTLLTTFNIQLIQLILPLVSPLWPSLFPGCFLEKDGSNTGRMWQECGRMWRLHWDCWWYHCPWLYRSQTWCLPMEAHRSYLQV